MYKNKKILAIIPARGGSKGIKNKNIIDLNGKPLIAYTIEAAKQSKYIDRVIVSTDSEEIRDVSIKFGADVPFLRPDELASDTAKTIDVLVHAVEKLEVQGEVYDYLVLLQATSPLRRDKHINEAIEQVIDNNLSSLVSVHEVDDHPLLVRSLDLDGRVNKLVDQDSTIRRQEFKKYYKVNGAIYINKITKQMKHLSLNDNEYAYIMEKEYCIDIDESTDLIFVKALLSESKY